MEYTRNQELNVMSELVFDAGKDRFVNVIGKPGRTVQSINHLPSPSRLVENSV